MAVRLPRFGETTKAINIARLATHVSSGVVLVRNAETTHDFQGIFRKQCVKNANWTNLAFDAEEVTTQWARSRSTVQFAMPARYISGRNSPATAAGLCLLASQTQLLMMVRNDFVQNVFVAIMDVVEHVDDIEDCNIPRTEGCSVESVPRSVTSHAFNVGCRCQLVMVSDANSVIGMIC